MRDRNANQIELILVRHGKTRSNEEGRYLGHREEDLSESGIQELLQNTALFQMLHQEEQAGEEQQEAEHKRLILTSPMRRCIQTMRLFYPDASFQRIEEWKEMNFGRFEGKNYQELNGDPAYQAYIDSYGENAFPEGESKKEFAERVLLGLKKAESQIKKVHRCVCFVHGGTIMALMSAFTGRDYFEFQVKNGGGFYLLLEQRKGRLQLTEWKQF